MKVIKRDGRKVDYDKSKIYNAILKAKQETEENINIIRLENIVNTVDFVIKDRCQKEEKDYIDIEDIQDIVEDTLMLSYNENQTAKRYIKYRYKKQLERQAR